MPEISNQRKRALVQKYAPHWKFNGVLPKSDIWQDSKQNRDEYYLPASVDGFFNEMMSGSVRIKPLTKEEKVEEVDSLYIEKPGGNEDVATPDDLARYRIGSQEVDDVLAILNQIDPYRDLGVNNYIRLKGYPKYMVGDVGSAATYFHTFYPPKSFKGGWGEDALAISYYLFYPYDTPGKILFKEIQEHRSDWENVAVVIDNASTNDTLHSLFYYGHKMPPKWVLCSEDEEYYRTTGSNHPHVYVSWGTHACYPEPGVIYDLYPVYDEFFTGTNEQELKSWNNSLVNLGGKSWNAFVGMWGPDGFSTQGSALSPAYKGRWGKLEKGKDRPMRWKTTKKKFMDRNKYQDLS